MKNRLLPLFLVLGMYAAHSQVAIGRKDPSTSLLMQTVKKVIFLLTEAETMIFMVSQKTKRLPLPLILILL